MLFPNNHLDYSIYSKQYLNLNIVCIQFACLLNHAPPHLCFLTATSRTCRSETPVAYLGLPFLNLRSISIWYTSFIQTLPKYHILRCMSQRYLINYNYIISNDHTKQFSHSLRHTTPIKSSWYHTLVVSGTKKH